MKHDLFFLVLLAVYGFLRACYRWFVLSSSSTHVVYIVKHVVVLFELIAIAIVFRRVVRGHRRPKERRYRHLCPRLWFALFWWGVRPLQTPMSPEAYVLLTSPLPMMLLSGLVVPLILGRGRRNREEEEADRFAAEMVGDPETVVHALRKIHTLSGQPHHLKKSDEALLNHPSLAHRIDALRRLPAATTERAEKPLAPP